MKTLGYQPFYYREWTHMRDYQYWVIDAMLDHQHRNMDASYLAPYSSAVHSLFDEMFLNLSSPPLPIIYMY